MKLTNKEVSILCVIAQATRHATKRDRNWLFKNISDFGLDDDAKRIALFMLGKSDASKSVRRYARDLETWAASLGQRRAPDDD